MSSPLERLGRRIRELRVQRGFASQEAFAEFLKVHRTFVGHLETGRKDFRLTSVIRVAEALEVPLAELFAGIDTDSPRAAKPTRGEAVKARYALMKEAAVLEEAALRLRRLAGGEEKAGPRRK